MSIMTRMEFALVVFFLFSFALSQDVFEDHAILLTVRRTLNRLPNAGQLAEQEVERIFAHPNGPLHQAMNAQPELFAALLFTVFRAFFAEEVFPQGNVNGRGNPLLVMLKDHQMLPQRYDPGRHHTVLCHFTVLHTAWTAHLGGRLVPADQAATVRRQVGIIAPHNDPDPNQLVPVPLLFQPLLVTAGNEPMQAEQQYGALEDRFLEVYVARYLVPEIRRNYFVQNNRPLMRLTVLQTLYWMLVVRPFQEVVAAHRELFENVNPNQLMPALNFDAAPVLPRPGPGRGRGRGRGRVLGPGPGRAPARGRGRAGAPAPALAPEEDTDREDSDDEDAYDDIVNFIDPYEVVGPPPLDDEDRERERNLPIRIAPAGRVNPPRRPAFAPAPPLSPPPQPRLSPPPLPVQGIGAHQPQGETIFGDAAVIGTISNQLQARRIFVPTVAAVDRLFEMPESAFHRAMAAQPLVYAIVLFTVFGRRFEAIFAGNQLGVGNQLPVLLRDHRLLPTWYDQANLHRLRTDWREFQNGGGGRALVHPPLRVIIARPEERATQEAAVPVPPLFRALFVDEPATLPYYFLWNRFAHYLNVYPADDRNRRRYFVGNGMEQSARRSHLKALYWMLVVQPFQRVVEGHPELFDGINPDELTPEDIEGGGGGHGPGGGGGGPGGPGGGGGPGGPGGGGGLPPPRNPPPQHSQPSCSSTSFSGTISTSGSQPQQGACSAKSAQKSSAPGADDGGSQSPPSKKHKPDDPSKGPGGGAGGGNGAGGGGVAGHV